MAVLSVEQLQISEELLHQSDSVFEAPLAKAGASRLPLQPSKVEQQSMSNLRNGVHKGKCSSADGRRLPKRVREKLGGDRYPLPNSFIDDTIPELRISEVRLVLALIPRSWGWEVGQDWPPRRVLLGDWHRAVDVRPETGLSARCLREAGKRLAERGLVEREKEGPGLGWAYRLTASLSPPDKGKFTYVPGWLFESLPQLGEGRQAGPLRVLLAIVRKTIGWKKARRRGGRDVVAYTQLEDATGLGHDAIASGIQWLLDDGLIHREGCGASFLYEITPPHANREDPARKPRRPPRMQTALPKESSYPHKLNKGAHRNDGECNNGEVDCDTVVVEGEHLEEEDLDAVTRLCRVGVTPKGLAVELVQEHGHRRVTEVMKEMAKRPRSAPAGWVRKALEERWCFEPAKASASSLPPPEPGAVYSASRRDSYIESGVDADAFHCCAFDDRGRRRWLYQEDSNASSPAHAPSEDDNDRHGGAVDFASLFANVFQHEEVCS